MPVSMLSCPSVMETRERTISVKWWNPFIAYWTTIIFLTPLMRMYYWWKAECLKDISYWTAQIKLSCQEYHAHFSTWPISQEKTRKKKYPTGLSNLLNLTDEANTHTHTHTHMVKGIKSIFIFGQVYFKSLF